MGALESGLERIGHTLEEVTEDDVIEPLPPNIVVLAAKLQDDTYVVKGVRSRLREWRAMEVSSTRSAPGDLKERP